MKDDINWENLQAQQRYLSWLRRLPVKKLKSHHRKVFPDGHKYHQDIPNWTPRYYYERRCYFWHVLHNFHLPAPFLPNMQRKAHEILSQVISDDTRPADMDIVRELRDFRKFTQSGIQALTESQVDKYLVRLGYLLEIPLDQKRQILLELYQFHPGDVVPRFSLTTGKPIRYLVRRTLRRLILEHPDWSFGMLVDKYGAEFDFKQASFWNARNLLRKAGYKLPDIRVRSGIVVKGKSTNVGKAIQAAHTDRLKGAKTARVPNRYTDIQEETGSR